MAQIVTIGEILVEIMAVERGQTFLEPGRFAGPFPSGAPAIVADQAARAGASVAIVACVGTDSFGALSMARLLASGVDVGAVKRLPGSATGSAIVANGTDGARDVAFNIAGSAAGLLSAEHLDARLFRGCRWFHVSGSSLVSPEITAAVRLGAALARAAGAQVSFDPNLRKELLGLAGVAATLDEMLATCDLALVSEADLDHFFPGMGELQAARRMVAAGRRMVVVKRGDRGCLYVDAERRIDHPAFLVDEVDPTGAGDCFCGALLAALVRGQTVERSLALAAAAGAHAVGQRGPMAGTATLAQLGAFLAADPPFRAVSR